MGHLILPLQRTLAAGLALVMAILVAVYLLSPGAETQAKVPVVSARTVLAGDSEIKMNEVGLYVLDYDPPYQPQVSLERAAAYLEEDAGVTALRGALIMVNTSPTVPNSGVLRGTVAESLAWAIEVDTRGTTQPDLFDPDHHTIAFIDADGGGLLGVLTQ